MPSSRLHTLLNSACRIFTVAALSLCALELMIAAEEPFIRPISFLLLFPFAICLSGATMLFHSKSVSAGMRLLGHFSLLTAGIFIFLFWPAGVFASGKSAITLIFVYLLLYFVLIFLSSLILGKKRRSASYTSLYDTKNDKK